MTYWFSTRCWSENLQVLVHGRKVPVRVAEMSFHEKSDRRRGLAEGCDLDTSCTSSGEIAR